MLSGLVSDLVSEDNIIRNHGGDLGVGQKDCYINTVIYGGKSINTHKYQKVNIWKLYEN